MKILFLTTHLNRGGISNYLLSVGAALRQKGHQIYLGSSGGDMEQEFRDKGFRLRQFSIRTKSELDPKIYWTLPKVTQWIREENIELIHAHTRVTQVMAAWIQWLTGTPFVTTAHGFYKRRFGRRLLPAWGERVIAISTPVGDELKDTFRVSAEKIRYIYNGIDLQDFFNQFKKHNPLEVRQEYGISKEDWVIGVTARLVSDKGHEYLIRAAKELEKEFPNLHVLIVGDGKYRPHLENLAQDLKLRARIHFTGNLKDVSRPLAAVDVFALPAVWREGFGLSIVEAMVCQKPVIVTNIWALNTLIQDRVNGVLVEPRSVKDLADAIRRFLEDPEFRERIGKAGQAIAWERFSLDRMAHELEKVYEEVLLG